MEEGTKTEIKTRRVTAKLKCQYDDDDDEKERNDDEQCGQIIYNSWTIANHIKKKLTKRKREKNEAKENNRKEVEDIDEAERVGAGWG